MREMCRRRLYYFLAVFSVLIVVTAIAISQTIIEYSPIILLKSTESNTGSIDIKVTPPHVEFDEFDGLETNHVEKLLLLNTTRIKQLVDPTYPDFGTSRYTFLGNVTKANCTECLSYSMQLILQNTEIEEVLGLGINLDLPAEIPEGEVVLSTTLAGLLGVNVGDVVEASIDMAELLQNLVISYNFIQPTNSTKIPSRNFFSHVHFTMPVVVNSITDSLIGKIPDSDFGITML